MKVIRGLSLCSTEQIQLRTELDGEEVIVEVEGENFTADLALPRRQCRELRDWLSVVLDD